MKKKSTYILPESSKEDEMEEQKKVYKIIKWNSNTIEPVTFHIENYGPKSEYNSRQEAKDAIFNNYDPKNRVGSFSIISVYVINKPIKN